MATNIADIEDEDAADHALANSIADQILGDDTDTARTRDPETGKFVSTKEESETPAKAEAEDAAPEEVSGEDEVEAEPETAIDPPTSWTAEAREAFSQLPPQLQQYVSERESEREKGINAKLSESAEARKKYESEAEVTKQERQKYAGNLQAVLSYAQVMDPIIAEGMRTDWVKSSQDDPVGTQTKMLMYQQRVQVLQAMQAESQRIGEENIRTAKESAQKKLTEAFPDFADEAKAKVRKDSYAPILLEAGFTQGEIDGIWNMPDPRIVKVLNEVVEGRKLKAAQKTVELKKVPPQAVKVARPKAVDDKQPAKSSRIAALEKRAVTSDSPRAMADWMAALIEENP